MHDREGHCEPVADRHETDLRLFIMCIFFTILLRYCIDTDICTFEPACPQGLVAAAAAPVPEALLSQAFLGHAEQGGSWASEPQSGLEFGADVPEL